jgi:hypothetical protein
LGDPDHITGSNIDSLYGHWQERQRKGLEPFVVLNAGPLHEASKKKSPKAKGKGKAKAQWVSCSSDDEKSQDGEEVAGGDLENEEEEDKSESDEKEEEEEEEEEEEPPARKFGPPFGKARSFGPSTKVDGSVTQEAGPSNISTSKKSLKKVEKETKAGKVPKSSKTTTQVCDDIQ